jgi:hypothetical protein
VAQAERQVGEGVYADARSRRERSFVNKRQSPPCSAVLVTYLGPSMTLLFAMKLPEQLVAKGPRPRAKSIERTFKSQGALSKPVAVTHGFQSNKTRARKVVPQRVAVAQRLLSLRRAEARAHTQLAHRASHDADRRRDTRRRTAVGRPRVHTQDTEIAQASRNRSSGNMSLLRTLITRAAEL